MVTGTDAKYGRRPGQAGSGATDLPPEGGWQLGVRGTRGHKPPTRALEEAGRESNTKQVPFSNFVKTPFGSQGPDCAGFVLSEIKKVEQAGPSSGQLSETDES